MRTRGKNAEEDFGVLPEPRITRKPLAVRVQTANLGMWSLEGMCVKLPRKV